MNLKVVGDRIAVTLIESEDKSFFKEKRSTELKGEVLSIGKDVTEVSVGEEILFDQHGMVRINNEGIIYVVTRESQVIAIL